MSIASWAKFLQEVLRVESGTPTIVSTSAGRETTSAITQMDELDSYGLGWVVTSRVWANGKVLVHSGTNTVNSSVAWVAPARNLAVLAVTNSFDGTEAERTWQALDALSARLILFYGEIAD